MKGQTVAGRHCCRAGFLCAAVQALPQGERAFVLAAQDRHFQQVGMPIRDQTEEDGKFRVREEARNKSQNVVVRNQIKQPIHVDFIAHASGNHSIAFGRLGSSFVFQRKPTLPGIRANRHNRVVVLCKPERGELILRTDLWLPRTVLEADFVVSMPKVKTHHWSGVTLSMKNMFGVVPGEKYGWPKNILHWKGIDRSILDICATAPVDFVIADAILAMEGNGPLRGKGRPLNQIVLADDPVAADATCARLMGLDPDKVVHIRAGAQFLGNSSFERIDQLGELVRPPVPAFQLLPEFERLREMNSLERKA